MSRSSLATLHQNDLNQHRPTSSATSESSGMESRKAGGQRNVSVWNASPSEIYSDSSGTKSNTTRTQHAWLTPFQIQRLACIKLQQWIRQRLEARRNPRVRCSNSVKRWFKFHQARRGVSAILLTSFWRGWSVRKFLLKEKSAVRVQTLAQYFLRRCRALSREKLLYQTFFGCFSTFSGRAVNRETIEDKGALTIGAPLACKMAMQSLSDAHGKLSAFDAYFVCRRWAQELETLPAPAKLHLTEAGEAASPLVALAVMLLVKPPAVVTSVSRLLSSLLARMSLNSDVDALCHELEIALTRGNYDESDERVGSNASKLKQKEAPASCNATGAAALLKNSSVVSVDCKAVAIKKIATNTPKDELSARCHIASFLLHAACVTSTVRKTLTSDLLSTLLSLLNVVHKISATISSEIIDSMLTVREATSPPPTPTILWSSDHALKIASNDNVQNMESLLVDEHEHGPLSMYRVVLENVSTGIGWRKSPSKSDRVPGDKYLDRAENVEGRRMKDCNFIAVVARANNSIPIGQTYYLPTKGDDGHYLVTDDDFHVGLHCVGVYYGRNGDSSRGCDYRAFVIACNRSDQSLEKAASKETTYVYTIVYSDGEVEENVPLINKKGKLRLKLLESSNQFDKGTPKSTMEKLAKEGFISNEGGVSTMKTWLAMDNKFHRLGNSLQMVELGFFSVIEESLLKAYHFYTMNKKNKKFCDSLISVYESMLTPISGFQPMPVAIQQAASSLLSDRVCWTLLDNLCIKENTEDFTSKLLNIMCQVLRGKSHIKSLDQTKVVTRKNVSILMRVVRVLHAKRTVWKQFMQPYGVEAIQLLASISPTSRGIIVECGGVSFLQGLGGSERAVSFLLVNGDGFKMEKRGEKKCLNESETETKAESKTEAKAESKTEAKLSPRRIEDESKVQDRAKAESKAELKAESKEEVVPSLEASYRCSNCRTSPFACAACSTFVAKMNLNEQRDAWSSMSKVQIQQLLSENAENCSQTVEMLNFFCSFPPSSNGGSSSGGADAAMATRVVMEVLAAKTGYDTEMIEDDMELETELGIDSIKRVEILSEVQSQLNVEAKNVDALSRTRTVGEVIAAMINEINGSSSGSSSSSAPVSQQAAPSEILSLNTIISTLVRLCTMGNSREIRAHQVACLVKSKGWQPVINAVGIAENISLVLDLLGSLSSLVLLFKDDPTRSQVKASFASVEQVLLQRFPPAQHPILAVRLDQLNDAFSGAFDQNSTRHSITRTLVGILTRMDGIDANRFAHDADRRDIRLMVTKLLFDKTMLTPQKSKGIGWERAETIVAPWKDALAKIVPAMRQASAAIDRAKASKSLLQIFFSPVVHMFQSGVLTLQDKDNIWSECVHNGAHHSEGTMQKMIKNILRRRAPEHRAMNKARRVQEQAARSVFISAQSSTEKLVQELCLGSSSCKPKETMGELLAREEAWVGADSAKAFVRGYVDDVIGRLHLQEEVGIFCILLVFIWRRR